MPNVNAELRDAIIAYKAYLKTGVRCMCPMYRDSEDGSGSVPVGEIECVSISGIYAVEELRKYQKRLDNAISAARADRTLGPALDALPDGGYGCRILIDSTVNPVAIAEPYRAQFKLDPWSERVRTDLLDALDRALARLPTDEGSDTTQGPDRSNTRLTEGIHDFLRRAQLCVAQIDLPIETYQLRREKGSNIDAAHKAADDEAEKVRDVANRTVQIGIKLIPALEIASFDCTDLLKFLNAVKRDLQAAKRLWPDVEASLQRAAIRVGKQIGQPVEDKRDGEEPGGDRRKQKGPAYERLTLSRSSDGSDHTADLDGKKIRIRGDAAFKMLDVLQRKKGARVKALLLQSEIKKRPDQVLKLLDKRLQRIIDPPQNGVGYAML